MIRFTNSDIFYLLVTQDHMQKFKFLQQFFNFFTPQYVIVLGVGGWSLNFFLSIGILFYR